MLERFVEGLGQNHLCKKEDIILLAVSGGLDSMVMLNLFHRGGYSVKVAHCNFQLRGEASDKDEIFVKQTCEQLGVPFYFTRFDTNNYAAEKGISIQMAARDLRYSWFNHLLEEEGCNLLATAHHLSDNVETVLLNLVRGTGASGLRGIPVRAENTIRPLLIFTKEELLNYAKEFGVSWREDISNASDDYDRNFLRHQVIPKLRELNPSLEKSFEKTIQRMYGTEALAKLGLDHLKSQYFKETANQIKISKTVLKITTSPVGLIWELLKEYGFNFDQCREIVKATFGQSGKQFYSNEFQLVIDREEWVISQLTEPQKSISVGEQDTTVTFGSLKMEIAIGPAENILHSKMTAVLDADKVVFPLMWRGWKDGDLFYPLGMENRKKLSDFFIDQKVSVADKGHATVLEAGGHIIWVVGHRIDNRYKVTENTKQVVQLTVGPIF